jgi:hypothetical protein
VRFRPVLECLEDRTVLDYSFGATPYQPLLLQPDTPGVIAVLNLADDAAAPVNLGGNRFNFYGTSYSNLFASSNGLLTFGSANASSANSDLKFSPTQAAIAPLWSDWYKDTGTPMLLALMDSNRLVLQWDNILHFDSSTPVTFQAVLQLNTGGTPGAITVNYVSIDTGDIYGNGATSTVGLKAAGPQGSNRVLVSFNKPNPLVGSGQALQFAWVDSNPAPVINFLSPGSAFEGSPDLALTVGGANFLANSVVQANGVPLATTFVSPTQLQATLPAFYLGQIGFVTISVFNPGSPGQTSNPQTFSVLDAPLAAQGLPVTASEGTGFSGPVASFSDLNPNGKATDYAAVITWGDGHTSAGSVSADGAGGFSVSGSNTYALPGSYSFSVQITDTAGGASATAPGAATVLDAPLSAQALPFTATEGSAFSGPVASFTDPNPGAKAADFSAVITWGDGHVSAGSVSADGVGGFLVTGSDTYASAGSYAFSVQISDLIGGATATAPGAATVLDALLSAQGLPFTTSEGSAFSGAVASFTDLNPNAQAADFSAVITWGDGHTSAGNVSADGAGGFLVSGSNTYAAPGGYAFSVQITDVIGGATATATGAASVLDAPLAAQGIAFSGQSGASFVGPVATFTDANPLAQPGDFTASIAWGDGTETPGRISVSSGGGFTITGGHTYAATGRYTFHVRIQDKGGATAAADGIAQIAGLSPDLAVSVTQSRQGRWVGLTGLFTDLAPGRHRARIDWGDGQFTTIALGSAADGAFSLKHNYRWWFSRRHRSSGVDVRVQILSADGTVAVQRLEHLPFGSSGGRRCR